MPPEREPPDRARYERDLARWRAVVGREPPEREPAEREAAEREAAEREPAEREPAEREAAEREAAEREAAEREAAEREPPEREPPEREPPEREPPERVARTVRLRRRTTDSKAAEPKVPKAEVPKAEVPEPEAPRGPSWRQGLITAVAVALGLGVGAGAIALLRDDGGEETQEVADRLLVQGPAIAPLVVGPDPAVGQPAPVLEGETLEGEPITTASAGRPRMLVFVAHWCTACRTELPRLVELADQGVFDDIDVTGVSTSASSNRSNYPASDWLRREKWPFPTVADTADRTAARAYGANDLPYFLFIDAGGVIAGRASGPVSAEDLTRIVDALATGQLAVPTTAPITP